MIRHMGHMRSRDHIDNALTQLLGIKYPIIQGGMIWASGWELAAAVSKQGGLGTLGAGSMYPDILDEHIRKCQRVTSQPIAVNLPLLYADVESHLDTIIKHRIPVVITSAGNPATYTARLQSQGIKVGHVVANKKFALKAQNAGVDFIIAEGVEAGGHNGKEEITTQNLLALLRDVVTVPLVAAGGIWDARSMLAAMILGAEGVQMGSRFVCSAEASCHESFKKAVITSTEGQTSLELKQLTPVRLLHNEFYEGIKKLETQCPDTEQLRDYLGRGRAKQGMFLGDLKEGELEIGQNAMLIDQILTVEQIMEQVKSEYSDLLSGIASIL